MLLFFLSNPEVHALDSTGHVTALIAGNLDPRTPLKDSPASSSKPHDLVIGLGSIL